MPIPDELTARAIAAVVFDVIWDTERRQAGEQSEWLLHDPTIKEEHAQQLAAAIGRQLDKEGWM